MTGRRVYIAGRMTGRPNFGFPDFESGESRVRALGDVPVSPHRLNIEHGWVSVERNAQGVIILATATDRCPSYADMLRDDFEALKTCDAIYMLPGWQGGNGCIQELREAQQLGLGVWGPVDERLVVEDWLRTHPRNQPLVGLIGYAQSGKDTVAGMLGYRRLAFADPLKRLAVACGPSFSVPDSGDVRTMHELVDTYGWEWCKAEVPGVREFLQDLGVGVRDILGYDTWVEAAFREYDPALATVFTDVRFPNEIAAIKDRGGVIVRIDRPGIEPPNGHVSETAWNSTKPDYTILNNGSLGWLQDLATDLAGNLGGTTL